MKAANERWPTSLQRALRFLYISAKYIFLIVVLVVLASHEAVKPGFRVQDMEYYMEDFRSGIREQMNRALSVGVVEEDSVLVREFYRQRDYLPVWTKNYEVTDDFNELIGLLASSRNYGLLPSFYQYEELKQLAEDLGKQNPYRSMMETRILLEEHASYAALKFLRHLAGGIRENDTTSEYLSFLENLPGFLNTKIRQRQLQDGILSLQPQNPQYERLQKALSAYLDHALQDTVKYSAGELRSDMELITAKLVHQGFLDTTAGYDSAAYQNAVSAFKRSHLMEESGEIDDDMLEYLGMSTIEKFYKIALNLDRIRKDGLEYTNSILVNIPEFQLHYYDTDGRESKFRVVVGKVSTPTPLITSHLESIITNPHWTVPRSIARYELLPRIKNDSLYLKRNGYSVVDNANQPVDASSIDWQNVNPKEFNYWIRQTKINNALGVVKFHFPNEYSVYFHDTPSKSLFNKAIRAYSHGCVRVENPQDLAQALVLNHTREKENVKETIEAREQKEIGIDDPISIYIRYYSCTADSVGNIYFHPDIYSKDEAAIKEIFAQGTWN